MSSSSAFLIGAPTDVELTSRLTETTWTPRRLLRVLLLLTGAGTLGLGILVVYVMLTGIGVWGNDVPVVWAFDITNFVFWIGIGHAGTFISAILYLLRQKWRTSINRIAEAMTLFAVLQAALFPMLHLGRPWFAYWLVPYPSTMDVWPQFRSALPWDAAAIATYFTVSVLFFYTGLLPDLAAVRDRAPTLLRRRVFGVLSLGFRGSARAWGHYRVAYGLLAGVATPLVVSVHSIVSMDFATTQLPGWHSTLFPPFFVAGAILSGFAAVFLLVLPARRIYRLHDVITDAHLDAMAKVLLATAWIVTYSYATEAYVAFRHHDVFERAIFLRDRPFGAYALLYWATIVCNCVAPQALWSRRARRSPFALALVSVFVLVGMWLERFVLIVTSEAHDFLPSSWRGYVPTLVDGGLLAGTFCCFAFLFLLFLRFFPFVPLSELKGLRDELALARKEAA